MKISKDPFEIAFEEQDESPPESPTGTDENEAQTDLVRSAGPTGKAIEEDEEENMEVELGKARMQAILSQFTEEQMSRYEFFRRSGFRNIKQLLKSLTGSANISRPMTIVVSTIAKMFVGELVETARIVMAERKDSGPIRPCHMREACRRLKLESKKIPKRSVPRLFR